MTPFLAYKNAVEAAEAHDGGEGFVTLESLAAQLSTKAWAGLESEDSVISKVLLSDSFKDAKKGQAADQIDKDILIMYGLFHCADKAMPVQKARGFYNILQEGGMEAHSHISASDKDMAPIFKKMCQLVTMDVFEFSSVKGLYDEDECEEL